MYCTNCGCQISNDANFCPNCGHTQKGEGKRKNPIFFILGVIAVILVILFFVGRREETPVPPSSEKEISVQEQPVQEQDTVDGEICPSCSGSGKCIACEGDGMCFYCDGTELQDCTWCWKSDICWSCHDGYAFDKDSDYKECEWCQGTGSCAECEDGKEKCDRCFDGGVCVYCMGDGDGVCGTCQGTGVYNPEENKTVYLKLECDICVDGVERCMMCQGGSCSFCDGTGKGLCLFGPCNECDNGYYGTCDSCGGSKICAFCYGKYIRECSVCRDGITIEMSEA